jgi:hypothetical protein
MKTIFFSLILIAVITLFCFSSTGKDGCIRERKYTWHDSTHIHLKSLTFYCDNLKDSCYTEWDSSGRITVNGSYLENNKIGIWENYIYSKNGKLLRHIYDNYLNGKLIESRTYEVIKDQENIYLTYNYYYSQNDTICVARTFDFITGYLTHMDSTLNGSVYGTSKSWDSRDGFLYLEIYAIDSVTNCNTKYNRDGSRFVTIVQIKPFKQIESYYSANGKLFREVIIDENGKTIKDKKYKK